MSPLMPALYGERVNRLCGSPAAVHYGYFPSPQPQEPLRKHVKIPQRWLIGHFISCKETKCSQMHPLMQLMSLSLDLTGKKYVNNDAHDDF